MKIVLDDNPIELRLKKIRLHLEALTPLEKDQLRGTFLERWPELELLYRGIEAEKNQEELRVFCELLPKAYTDGIERIFLFLKK